MMRLRIVFLLILVSHNSAIQASSNGTGELRIRSYCDSETFRPKCLTDHVIVMETAFYGRMQLGRCVRVDLGYIGCRTDVLPFADRKCSGLHECQIRIPNNDFHATKPCPIDLKSYLEVSYSCLRVLNEGSICAVSVSAFQPIHISSLTTNLHDCGSDLHPWIIQADPGHQLNVTLMDFSRNYTERSSTDLIPAPCVRYGHLFESNGNTNVSICGGSRQRIQQIYRSKTDVVEMVFLKRATSTKKFIVRFEGIWSKTPNDGERTTLSPRSQIGNKDANPATTGLATTSYCQGETFQPKCLTDHVIVMETALYGRMESGRCVRTDFGFVGCGTDVLPIADRKCSGLHECQIRIPDLDFDSTNPCPTDFKSYLEASYSCLRVLNEDSICAVSVSAVQPIHIFSLIINRHDCGSDLHPWVIQTDLGHQLTVTLMDFSTDDTKRAGTDRTPAPCFGYGHLFESNGNTNVSICGGTRQRIHQIYRSKTNVIEMVFLKRATSTKKFIVLFEGIWSSTPNYGKRTTLSPRSQIGNEDANLATNNSGCSLLVTLLALIAASCLRVYDVRL